MVPRSTSPLVALPRRETSLRGNTRISHSMPENANLICLGSGVAFMFQDPASFSSAVLVPASGSVKGGSRLRDFARGNRHSKPKRRLLHDRRRHVSRPCVAPSSLRLPQCHPAATSGLQHDAKGCTQTVPRQEAGLCCYSDPLCLGARRGCHPTSVQQY